MRLWQSMGGWKINNIIDWYRVTMKVLNSYDIDIWGRKLYLKDKRQDLIDASE